MHVVVPLRRAHAFETVKDFSRAVVDHLVGWLPQRFSGKSKADNRIGRICIDYLRKGLGATTVAAWSARARPGLGATAPLAWDELAELSSAAHWTVQNVGRRLTIGNQPWRAYAASPKGPGGGHEETGLPAPRLTVRRGPACRAASLVGLGRNIAPACGRPASDRL